MPRGGIIIADTAKEKPHEGEIVAARPPLDGQAIPHESKEGDLKHGRPHHEFAQSKLLWRKSQALLNWLMLTSSLAMIMFER
jgi:hypothetical protein